MKIQHRLMRDVYAEVLEDTSKADTKQFKVLWVNKLGTFEHPSPFPMGTNKQFAIEVIEIPSDVFAADWIELA